MPSRRATRNIGALDTNVRSFPATDISSPYDPVLCFAVESDGETVASGDISERSYVGAETGRMIRLTWTDGHLADARAVLTAALAAADPGTEVHLATNVEFHEHVADRLALAEECGFEIWQEKEGFWWADNGQELPEPDRVVTRTLEEVGFDRFVEVVAGCAVATLDRVDASAIAEMGATGWAAALTESIGGPEDAATCFFAETPAGQTIGFVAVGAFDEETTGTVQHIGVLPAHRGRGYVDQLLRVANRAARDRGFTGMVCDVDVDNPPMVAAMERNGHHADMRPWHKWYHRRVA